MSQKVRVVLHMSPSEHEACLRASEKERRTLQAWVTGRLFGLDSLPAVLTTPSEVLTPPSEVLTPPSEVLTTPSEVLTPPSEVLTKSDPVTQSVKPKGPSLLDRIKNGKSDLT